MMHYLLRMNNFDSSDLFAKHQTIFNASQPEIINAVT